MGADLGTGFWLSGAICTFGELSTGGIVSVVVGTDAVVRTCLKGLVCQIIPNNSALENVSVLLVEIDGASIGLESSSTSFSGLVILAAIFDDGNIGRRMGWIILFCGKSG